MEPKRKDLCPCLPRHRTGFGGNASYGLPVWVECPHSGFWWDDDCIVSGFIGVAIYVTVPSKLSENTGSQTFVELKSQLDQVNLQLDKVLFELDGASLKLAERVLKADGVLVSQLKALLSKVELPVFEQFRDSIQQARNAGTIGRDLSLTVLRLTQSKASLVKRIRLHQRYKALISIWLAVHVPFTIFSMLLVGIHIFAVFYYW